MGGPPFQRVMIPRLPERDPNRVTMSKTKEQATIPISPESKEALNELRFGRSDDGPVLQSGGTAWSWTVLRRYFLIAKKLAGIERPLRFHDLPHTFASRLASAGVSLQVIARMLGHTSVQMSQRYARPDERALRAAMDLVARMNSGMNSRSSDETASPGTGEGK